MTKDVLDQPTSVLKLPTRARNLLKQLGITTLRELTGITKYDCLDYKNFGWKSLNTLRMELSRHGLTLKEEDEIIPSLRLRVGNFIQEQEQAMTHTDLVKEAIQALWDLGICCWPHGTGMSFRQGPMRYGYPGSSDIVGWLPGTGRFLGAEAKTGKDKLRKDQEEFRYALLRDGGVYIVFYSVEELLENLVELTTMKERKAMKKDPEKKK